MMYTLIKLKSISTSRDFNARPVDLYYSRLRQQRHAVGLQRGVVAGGGNSILFLFINHYDRIDTRHEVIT